MPRFYVEHEGKWNVFSTISDDYIFTYFMEFDRLKRCILSEDSARKSMELDTLLTDRPTLNVMSYEEAQEIIESKEQENEDANNHIK